ncbi:hypothetical protein Raf01_70790 [Rugosimonospora africana]|uniref:Uncharacterized protein n=1 Tax=Rugosimonospora africana TaxID=556532 RepID=A0A8J3QZA6_9ACTN|nr:hypothetical protein Raf01_70790 [Rugosimonospora africana]
MAAEPSMPIQFAALSHAGKFDLPLGSSAARAALAMLERHPERIGVADDADSFGSDLDALWAAIAFVTAAASHGVAERARLWKILSLYLDGLDRDDLFLTDQWRVGEFLGDDPSGRRGPALNIMLPLDGAFIRVEGVVVAGFAVPDLPAGVARADQNRRDGSQHPPVAAAMRVTRRIDAHGQGTPLPLRARAMQPRYDRRAGVGFQAVSGPGHFPLGVHAEQVQQRCRRFLALVSDAATRPTCPLAADLCGARGGAGRPPVRGPDGIGQQRDERDRHGGPVNRPGAPPGVRRQPDELDGGDDQLQLHLQPGPADRSGHAGPPGWSRRTRTSCRACVTDLLQM